MSIDVVVVGAGAAGIAAARCLLAAGCRVTVLEARDRLGGRAHTVALQAGVPVDLGAAWLHFADQNALTRLAREQGCTVPEVEPGWGAQGRVGQRQLAATEVAEVAAALDRNFNLVSEAALAGRDVAVAEVVPDDRWRPRFDAVMTWAVGAESRDVSTLDLHRYADSAHDWMVVEGLGQALCGAAAGLPVQTACAVRHIDWSGSGVRIDSTQGVLRADAVVVTVPTSLLAQDRLRFTPPLPATHRDAAANLPLGVANKVFFSFADGALPPGEAENVLAHDDRSRTLHFTLRAARQPVVMAYFGGDLSRELEATGELAGFAREALRETFGADLHDAITGIRATHWGSEPWSRGSYSAARPGHADARAQLAQPLASRLWFAGEACDLQHFGTVHGAWLSGAAAANQILQDHGVCA